MDRIQTWIVTSGPLDGGGEILGVYPGDRATAFEHFTEAAKEAGADVWTSETATGSTGSLCASGTDTWVALDVFGPGPVEQEGTAE